MSDDEAADNMDLGGMSGMGGMPDDDSDGGDDYRPPENLPEGLNKEMIAEADGANWKKPKSGDEVTVHYVGTLESDGSEFDSSRGRDQPFTFTLGKGNVIKGWDLGVATMKKGEIAKFTIASDLAYGDNGSPPKIPEKATLVFEVELLSWVSKDDLFGDEGAIKIVIEEGDGYKTPKEKDECLISVKVAKPDETVVVEKCDLEYTIGSSALGSVSRTIEKALMGMKKGEKASLKCTMEYACDDKTPDGANIELQLQEIYETKDCSFEKNSSLMKKTVKEGETYKTPKDTAKVKLSVKSATDGTTSLPGFAGPKLLEFVAGNGDVCEALELVVSEMNKGEHAVVTCTNPAACCELELGIPEIPAGKVVFSLELVDFENAKDTWDMSEEEKLEFASGRKDIGALLFKKGKTTLALQRYKKVVEMFNYVDNFKADENKQKAKDLKKVCELNKAACFLKLEDYTMAKQSCDAVMKDDKNNVKAIFRYASACFGQAENIEAAKELNRVLELDPDNADAKRLLPRVKRAQKDDDKKSKDMFSKMFKSASKVSDSHSNKENTPATDVPAVGGDITMTEAVDGAS